MLNFKEQMTLIYLSVNHINELLWTWKFYWIYEMKAVQNVPPTLEIEEWFIVEANVGGAPGWTVRAYGWKTEWH